MKTIIAGSRNIIDENILHRAISKIDWEITEVVCGGARGADTLGKFWAIKCNIKIKYFYADWDKHGRFLAGFMRNEEMADYGECLIALWNGNSNGTRNMINLAKQNNLKIHIEYINK